MTAAGCFRLATEPYLDRAQNLISTMNIPTNPFARGRVAVLGNMFCIAAFDPWQIVRAGRNKAVLSPTQPLSLIGFEFPPRLSKIMPPHKPFDRAHTRICVPRE